MSLLVWVLPAFAASLIAGAPDNVAPLLAPVVDRCIAEKPWWGQLALRIYPGSEGDPPTFSISAADDALLDTDSEHYYAAPNECIETGLVELSAKTPAIQEWLAEAGFVEMTATVPRDEAALARITMTGASAEIVRRLRDRAQRCAATNSPGTSWLDVEVVVGRNGFVIPTVVVHGKRDGGLSECLSNNYLGELDPSTKPSLSTVIVSIAGPDGKVPPAPTSPVKFASARAYTRGGTAISVDLNTSALTCDQLFKARYDVPSGEKSAEFTVQQVYRGDGSAQWRVVNGWYANSTSSGDQGPATVVGDTTKGVTVTLPPGFVVGRDPGLALGPTIAAIGCGDHPQKTVRGDAPDGTPAAVERDLSGLTFTVAGNPIALKGAILMGKGSDERLEFSTEAASCYAGWSDADIAYTVDLPQKNAGSTFLSGTRMPSQISDDYDAKDKAVITLGKPADGVMSLDIQLAYDHGGYPVSLRGKTTVLDCRR